MNENGIGKRKNLEKAFQWYKAAADHGSAKGQNALGHCYYRGTGIAQDYFQAIEAFKASALSVCHLVILRTFRLRNQKTNTLFDHLIFRAIHLHLTTWA